MSQEKRDKGGATSALLGGWEEKTETSFTERWCAITLGSIYFHCD